LLELEWFLVLSTEYWEIWIWTWARTWMVFSMWTVHSFTDHSSPFTVHWLPFTICTAL